jgi:DNA-directed RNA polymerase subunit RPC12/RpoP
MNEDDVLWSMSCGACDHEWMQTTPSDSSPQEEQVECPECGSQLLDAAYAGRS